ncbi:hypothetical protein ABW20_dc0109902 [Dactylellina cionopaga]|nr:hypothetical protein ABW20_dc0109902 [Dactylellina cionopaga]
MAKRKRSGKKTTSYQHHQPAYLPAPSTSAEPQQQLDYEETSVEQDETIEEEEYVWGSKPLKSSRSSVFGGGSKGYVDPSTNQRGAFPELQDIDDDEDLSGPAVDGLSYLRMVRHEARGVPNLLTASQLEGNSPVVKASAIVIAAPIPIPAPATRPVPTNDDGLLYDDDNAIAYNENTRPMPMAVESLPYDDDNIVPNRDDSLSTPRTPGTPKIPKEAGRLSYDDEYEYKNNDGEDDEWDDEEVYDELSDSESSAYYDDGAYIARPAPTLPTQHPTGKALSRVISTDWHDSLVANFLATRDAILTTPFEDPETPFPANPTEWRDFMVENQPSLPVLQSIPSENAIKALKHIRKNLGWVNVNEWQGKWIWALLARANDVGILLNEEVSVLRELGKKAVFNLGKAADARLKIVESGGEDWWDEEMQSKVMEYMSGGGQTEEASAAVFDVNIEVYDGDGVRLDAQVELPVESSGRQMEDDDQGEERPAKKMALFKPRAVVVSKPKVGGNLAVPVISVTPATPGTDVVTNPMEDPLASAQLLKEIADASPDDQLAAAQLQFELESGADSSETENVSEMEITGPTEEEKLREAVEEHDGALEVAAAPRVPDVKTIFALDMIVSIVGDVFGQRDLLLERR